MVRARWWLLAATALGVSAPAMETQFIGFSPVAVPGHVGLVGLHGACQRAFGKRARLCVAADAVGTAEIARFVGEFEAWIQPTTADFPCAGWSSSIGSGTVLDARTMSFGSKPCAMRLPVTCCQ